MWLIEMKYFFKSFLLILNYVSKVALKEFLSVFFYRQAHVHVIVCI